MQCCSCLLLQGGNSFTGVITHLSNSLSVTCGVTMTFANCCTSRLHCKRGKRVKTSRDPGSDGIQSSSFGIPPVWDLPFTLSQLASCIIWKEKDLILKCLNPLSLEVFVLHNSVAMKSIQYHSKWCVQIAHTNSSGFVILGPLHQVHFHNNINSCLDSEAPHCNNNTDPWLLEYLATIPFLVKPFSLFKWE